MRGQGRSCPEVRAHQQRIDDTRRRARVGETLVATWRHSGEGEGGAAEYTRERGDLVDVVGGVAADAFGIVAIDMVDQIAANVLAIGPRDAEVFRNRLEPVSGKF